MASFEHGQMYEAQSHAPVEFAVIRLEGGPTESHSRLNMDVLFRSAAMPCRRLVGAILTGAVCNVRASKKDRAD